MSFISYENGQTLFGKVGNAIKGQEGLLSETVGWTGKNVLVNKAVSKTESGVTLTVNKNANNEVLSMVLNGTATADINFWMPDTIESSFHVDAGEYILSAGDVQLSGNFDIQLFRKGATNYETPSIILRNGDRANFVDGNYHVRIYIRNGTTLSNVTVYPMLRDARISDSTYEPHHDSVDACKADNSVIAPVESGSTASQAYAQGAHFIRSKKFCTAITSIASGATLTKNTNYTEGDVASALSSGGGGNSPFPAWTDIPSSDKVEAANSSVTMGALLNSFFDKIDASKLGVNSKMVIYDSSYKVSCCIPLMYIAYTSGTASCFIFALMLEVSHSLYTYIFNVMASTSGSTLYLYQSNNTSDKTSQTASWMGMPAIAIIY